MLNTSFVIARALEDPLLAPGQSVLWIFLTPIINITFAWLLDECLDLMMDTLKHSPWDKLNPLEIDDRAKFVYLSTGGGRPVLLNLRSSLAAILAAAFVPPRPRSRVKHARVVRSDGTTLESGAAGSSIDDEWWTKKEGPRPALRHARLDRADSRSGVHGDVSNLPRHVCPDGREATTSTPFRLGLSLR